MVGRWYGFDLIAREGARRAMLSSLVRQRLWPPPTCGSLWPRHFRQDGLWLAGELSGFLGGEPMVERCGCGGPLYYVGSI